MSRFSKNQKDLYTAVEWCGYGWYGNYKVSDSYREDTEVYSIKVNHVYRDEIFEIDYTKDFDGDVHEKCIITDETTLAEYNVLRKALEEFYGIYL